MAAEGEIRNPFIPLLYRALNPAGRPATGVPVPTYRANTAAWLTLWIGIFLTEHWVRSWYYFWISMLDVYATQLTSTIKGSSVIRLTYS